VVIHWRKVDPEQLEPQFRRDVEGLLTASPFTWYVTSGHRSLAEQKKLYEIYRAGGPLAAFPGRSAHNFGLAIDVVLDGNDDKPGLQPDWNPSEADGWMWLQRECARHPRLEHGSKFGDWPHVQRFRWAKHKAWTTPKEI
jgi:hypothetical protein